MRKILAIAVVAALFAAGAAEAQAPAASASGFSLGARVGYGIPMGDADASMSQSDLVSGMIPLQLDLGYRFNPNWQVGLYFQYGFATVADFTCTAGGTVTGLSCSGSNVRFGAQAIYTFASEGFSPWLGLGLGYEWQNITLSAGGLDADMQLSGFEYLNLQFGGDWKLSPTFKMGPFVSFSFGSYDTLSLTDPTGATTSGSLANTGTHEWLQIGLKGAFDF